MGTVTTSLVVEFASSRDGLLTAEIDDRPGGFNAGKTSFYPGDKAYFLVFKSPSVTIDVVASSAGIIVPWTPGTYAVTDEWVNFEDTDEASASRYIDSGFTYQWFGNNLGPITIRDGKMVAASKGIGVAKISYLTNYLSYYLQSPSNINGKTRFNILVMVKGHD